MGSVIDGLTGKTARQSYKLAAAQADEQRARLAEEDRKLTAVEDGQRRMRSGGRGFLAFLEDNGLADKLGSSAEAKDKRPAQTSSSRIDRLLGAR